jgi:beta-glucosidase
VVVLGEWQQMIGEAASRSSLSLPGRQLELLHAVVATGTPVVLLLMNGRPLDLRGRSRTCPPSSTSGIPGERGAVRLSATCSSATSPPAASCPSRGRERLGRCPMIYAHTTSHEPENQSRRYWDEESTPLFPFGFGLSYGRLRLLRSGPRPQVLGAARA